MFKRIAAILLAACMTISFASCNNGEGGQDPTQGKYDTLVIGVSPLNGVFSPFFYTSAYDAQVIDMVFSPICVLDADNVMIPAAGSISAEQIDGDNGQVQTKYTVKVQEGMKFTDGEPVTIDDVLFTYYVYLDPNYDGMGTMNTLPIVGLNEYKYDTPDYSQKIAEFQQQSQNITDEELDAFVEKYTDLDMQNYGAAYINEALGLGLDESAADFEEQVRAAYLAMNMESKEDLRADAQADKYDQLIAGFVTGNLSDGIDVESISGIERIDDYTCTVLVDGISITADRQLALQPILPEHYYGPDFQKGDLSAVHAKDAAPMGSGPYIFQSYNNNIVSLTANPDYYKGEPKIKNLKFQVVSEDDKVNATILGDIDITDPSASIEVMEQLHEEGIEYSLVDNNGYGYIAINAKRVPDINVRKGLMHLMNRGPAIEAYYGELAEVIERPMTTTLAEYPDDATEYYGYSPEKAAEYFEKAGYTKDASGKLVNSDGEQLSIEIGIGELSNHPAAGILTQMKIDMDALGAEFIISDMDPNVLFDRMQNDDLDMFVAAWGNANDCDLTQIFSSSSTVPGGSNRVWLQDEELDKLILQSTQTLDLEERSEIVAQELDIIMDWAVYMPIYQRKNLIIYNPEVVNTDTLPERVTTYWTYASEIENLELH